MRSGSSHSACASTKSIPCFALFAVDFAVSNSNRIWYRNYTITTPAHGLLDCSQSQQLKQTVCEVPKDTGPMQAHPRSVEADLLRGFCASSDARNRHQIDTRSI